jgi:hypothetical protein
LICGRDSGSSGALCSTRKPQMISLGSGHHRKRTSAPRSDGGRKLRLRFSQLNRKINRKFCDPHHR